MTVLSNKAKCAGCGHVLESTHRHDFRTHGCVQNGREYWFMVDGGREYIRRGWKGGKPEDHFIELSEEQHGKN